MRIIIILIRKWKKSRFLYLPFMNENILKIKCKYRQRRTMKQKLRKENSKKRYAGRAPWKMGKDGQRD